MHSDLSYELYPCWLLLCQTFSCLVCAWMESTILLSAALALPTLTLSVLPDTQRAVPGTLKEQEIILFLLACPLTIYPSFEPMLTPSLVQALPVYSLPKSQKQPETKR